MALQSSLLQNAATATRKITQQAASGLQQNLSTGYRNHGNETLEFPQDLADLQRPLIRFSCIPHDSTLPVESITLPLPQGVVFNDIAAYSQINMGTISAMADIAQAAGNADGIAGKIKAAAGEAGAQTFSGGGIGASILLSKKLGLESVAKTIEFSSRQIVNPRTNTAFDGNGLRAFQFDFKMIGSNEAEVRIIDSIQNVLRSNTYASEVGGRKTMLQYPSLWHIEFLSPDMTELEFMPKIFSCYITGLTTTVNQSANIFRTDYSPHEIDISVQFQESKILTRNELEDLENNSNRSNADTAFITEKSKDLVRAQNKLISKLAADEAANKQET
jgi:hypothetical protein